MTPKPIKHIAKETLFVVMSIVCMVVISVISSVANAGLDMSKLWTKENQSMLLINASITLFGMLGAVPSGIVSTKQRLNSDGSPGRYIQEFTAYNNIRTKIEPRRNEFGQWHHQKFLDERKTKCERFLLDKGISQISDIMRLSREQILQLTTSQVFKLDGEDVYFKALSQAQLEACIKVYDGKVSLHKLPDFYFLYVDGKSKMSFYEQAYNETRSENLELIGKMSYKIVLGFLITSIFTGLVVDYAQDGIGDNMTAYVLHTLILITSRIFNALSSTLWGFLIGQEQVYMQCYYINGKTQFLEEFDKDKDFKYVPVRQVAKEEYLKSLEGGTNLGNENIPESKEATDILV